MKRWLRKWRGYSRSLLRRRQLEEDVERELQFHLEQATERNVAEGYSPREAGRRAQRALGQVDLIKADCRHAWGARQLDALLHDAGYAMRGVCRYPTFAVTAAITLALGIGATSAVFTVTNAVLLRPLPYAQPEQLVIVRSQSLEGTAAPALVDAELADLNTVRGFSDVAAVMAAGGDLGSFDGASAINCWRPVPNPPTC